MVAEDEAGAERGMGGMQICVPRWFSTHKLQKERDGSPSFVGANRLPACPTACLQEKNVGSDMLEGKVGHIYMPKQDVAGMALAKPKGVKRERRQAAADAAVAKKQRTAAAAAGAARDDSD